MGQQSSTLKTCTPIISTSQDSFLGPGALQKVSIPSDYFRIKNILKDEIGYTQLKTTDRSWNVIIVENKAIFAGMSI